MQNVVRQNLSKTDMRNMLTKRLDNMRRIRKEVLLDGVIYREKHEKYIEEAAACASFVEALENEELIAGKKMKIVDIYNADAALKHYDNLQERWWADSSEGKTFLRALRAVAAHYLHGSMNGSEDVYHVFQMIKQRHEDDDSLRTKETFILPIYGGVDIPATYLGPLLASLTGNRHLVPAATRKELSLMLEWYPDDGAAGVAEVQKVIEAASLLGFPGIKFRMPSEYSYDDLYKKFGEALLVKKDDAGFLGNIACRQQNDAHPDGILQLLETGEKKISEVAKTESTGFDGNVYRIIRWQGDKLVAACIDSVGFSKRVLFTVEEGEDSVRGGLYLSEEHGRLGTTIATCESFMSKILETVKSMTHVVVKDQVEQMLANAGKEAELFGEKAMLIYATIRNGRTRQEIEVEGVEEDEN